MNRELHKTLDEIERKFCCCDLMNGWRCELHSLIKKAREHIWEI